MREASVIPIDALERGLYRLCVEDGEQAIPLYASCVSAGFPSPADDHIEDRINLGNYLVQNPASTFMMRVRGTSMADANIHEGDILVIDRSLKPEDGRIAVCFLDGEFTVKTIRRNRERMWLQPANPAFDPIELTDEMDVRVWGVVAWILHKPARQ
jgi:DNA polymerase V